MIIVRVSTFAGIATALVLASAATGRPAFAAGGAHGGFVASSQGRQFERISHEMRPPIARPASPRVMLPRPVPGSRNPVVKKMLPRPVPGSRNTVARPSGMQVRRVPLARTVPIVRPRLSHPVPLPRPVPIGRPPVS